MERQTWRAPWRRDRPVLAESDLARANGTTASPWPGPPALEPEPSAQVPAWLARAAGWSWRILLIGLLIYISFRVATAMRIVVLPCVAALLLTALLQPLARRLRSLGLPRLAATWCAMLIAVAVIAAAGALVATQVSADYHTLAQDIGSSAHELQRWLAGPPFNVHSANLEQLSGRLLTFLRQHQSTVAGTVLSGGRLFLEILGGAVLMLFVTFFFLKDGEQIWAWLVGFLSPEGRRRAQGAGEAAWRVLVHYVRGTVVVATIHALVIGVTLWLIGVPLLAPLVILVFLAAFVPLVGILVAGTAAVAVTLGTQGWLAAVVLIAVFVVENQIESHLLQPVLIGRMVRLHPLAIILALAVGGVVAGVPGAIVAVPTAAALVRAGPYLQGRRSVEADIASAPCPRPGAPAAALAGAGATPSGPASADLPGEPEPPSATLPGGRPDEPPSSATPADPGQR